MKKEIKITIDIGKGYAKMFHQLRNKPMDNFTIEGNGEELVFTLSNGQKFSFPSYMFSNIVDAIMQGSDMQYASQCAAWHNAGRATAINWRPV